MRNAAWLAVTCAVGAAAFLLGRVQDRGRRATTSAPLPPAVVETAAEPRPAPAAPPDMPQESPKPERPPPTPEAEGTSPEAPPPLVTVGTPADLVADGEAFARLFERKIEGPTVDGTVWERWIRYEDGTTLDFPDGAHLWRGAEFGNRRVYPRGVPRDLVVQGRGMDRTIVRLGFDDEEGLTNLLIRDVTSTAATRASCSSRNARRRSASSDAGS